MNTKRIPRPKGLTELSIIYNKTQTEEALNNLQTHIIKHYVYTDFRLNHEKLNLEEFSQITGIHASQVYPYIMDYNKLQYNFLDETDKQKLYGDLTNGILMGSLKDRMAIEKHVNVMLQSQGAGYKAFISSEVTRALKLLIDSNANMLQIHQRLFGQNAPTVTITNQNQQNSLTVLEAQEMIQSNETVKPLLEDPEAREQLYLDYNLSDMPEVNANKQQGIDTSNEGLGFNALVLDSNTDDAPITHIDRRAEELDLDLDQDNI